jgi:hypothetical protein
VELQKILSILFRPEHTSVGKDIVQSPASTQETSNPLVLAAKSALNFIATGFAVGDELTTIAVKASAATN